MPEVVVVVSGWDAESGNVRIQKGPVSERVNIRRVTPLREQHEAFNGNTCTCMYTATSSVGPAECNMCDVIVLQM